MWIVLTGEIMSEPLTEKTESVTEPVAIDWAEIERKRKRAERERKAKEVRNLEAIARRRKLQRQVGAKAAAA